MINKQYDVIFSFSHFKFVFHLLISFPSFLPDRDYYRVNNPPQWVTFAIFILIFSGLLSYPLSLMRSTLIGWMSSASTVIVGLFL